MVQINQVIMTVVQPDILTIRATVAEKELHRLRPGLSGVATPAAYPDMKLNAVLTQWSEIPVGPGSFDATLQVNLDKKTKSIVPGMSCKVKLNAYLKKDALTVPVATLMTDEADDRQYVWVLGKDNKPARRYVTVGPRSDKSAEIAQGLAAGDKVLLEAPKDAK
jgi:multidrug efflux pump subunit AcrA (membrane-fusion protein)